MKESDIRGEVYNLLERAWLWPVSQTDLFVCRVCKELNHPPAGRPDILALNPNGPSLVVEVKTFPRPSKTGATSFPFSKIEPQQRQWLDNWDADCGIDSPGAFLALGTVHGRAGSLKSPRRLWLLPWSHWKVVEVGLSIYQASLPLLAEKARKMAIKRFRLDAVTLLQSWALVWDSGGWHLPPSHPLWVEPERDLKAFRGKWQRSGRVPLLLETPETVRFESVEWRKNGL